MPTGRRAFLLSVVALTACGGSESGSPDAGRTVGRRDAAFFFDASTPGGACDPLCEAFETCKIDTSVQSLQDTHGLAGACIASPEFSSTCRADCESVVEQSTDAEDCLACQMNALSMGCESPSQGCRALCGNSEKILYPLHSYREMFGCWIDPADDVPPLCAFGPETPTIKTSSISPSGPVPIELLSYTGDVRVGQADANSVLMSLDDGRAFELEVTGFDLSQLQAGVTYAAAIDISGGLINSRSLVFRDRSTGVVLVALWMRHPPPALPGLQFSYEPERCRSISTACFDAIPLSLKVDSSTNAVSLSVSAGEQEDSGPYRVMNGPSALLLNVRCSDIGGQNTISGLWLR